MTAAPARTAIAKNYSQDTGIRRRAFGLIQVEGPHPSVVGGPERRCEVAIGREEMFSSNFEHLRSIRDVPREARTHLNAWLEKTRAPFHSMERANRRGRRGETRTNPTTCERTFHEAEHEGEGELMRCLI